MGASSLSVRLALVLPFLFIGWLAWVRTLQQERERPKTSLAGRDATRVARQMRRRLGGPAAEAPKKEEPRVAAQTRPLWAAVRPVSEQVEQPLGVTTTSSSGSDAAACPGRKPFHTLLTATAQPYQQWQCRFVPPPADQGGPARLPHLRRRPALLLVVFTDGGLSHIALAASCTGTGRSSATPIQRGPAPR